MPATQTPPSTNARPNLDGLSQPDTPASTVAPAGWRVFPPVSGAVATAVALMLLGAALRMFNLDARSLWIDEIVSANSASQPSLQELISWTQADYDQMPMFNLIVWLMRGLPQNEVTLRMPSAIAGVLCVGVVYLLGRTLYNQRVGLAAGALMAVLPFAVWYSQEARIYSIFMLLTASQMLFAYRAATRSRLPDWILFAIFTVLNLYAHYMALTATAAAFAFIGIVLVADSARTLWARSRRRQDRSENMPTGKDLAKRLAYLVGGGVIAGFCYLPWLSALQSFLNNPGKGFGRYKEDPPVTLERIGSLLVQLDFANAILWMLCAGGIVVAAYAARGRWRQGTFLLCWFAVPLGGLGFKIHGAVLDLVPRYLSFLVPAAVIVTAVGVDGVANLVGRAIALLGRSARARLSLARAGVWAALGLLVLALTMQVWAAPTEPSMLPKDDYRQAARMVAAGPPKSVVIAVGRCSNFLTQALDYYFGIYGTQATVIDAGNGLTDVAARSVESATGWVWAGAHIHCAPRNDVSKGPGDGLLVTSLTGVEIVREATPQRSTIEQAKAVIRWGSGFDPQLESAADVLDLFAGNPTIGENLLPPPANTDPSTGAKHWDLIAGAQISQDKTAFSLTPTGQEVAATIDIANVKPGERYLLTFEYRNIDLDGDQRVYVSVHDPGGGWVDVFPSGAGYTCQHTENWTKAAVGFTISPKGTSLRVWLTAQGTGTAKFRSVELHKVH